MKITVRKNRRWAANSHKWFAWHPVIAYDGDDKVLVWLTTIERCATVWYRTDPDAAFSPGNLLLNMLSLGTIGTCLYKIWIYDTLNEKG